MGEPATATLLTRLWRVMQKKPSFESGPWGFRADAVWLPSAVWGLVAVAVGAPTSLMILGLPWRALLILLSALVAFVVALALLPSRWSFCEGSRNLSLEWVIQGTKTVRVPEDAQGAARKFQLRVHDSEGEPLTDIYWATFAGGEAGAAWLASRMGMLRGASGPSDSVLRAKRLAVQAAAVLGVSTSVLLVSGLMLPEPPPWVGAAMILGSGLLAIPSLRVIVEGGIDPWLNVKAVYRQEFLDLQGHPWPVVIPLLRREGLKFSTSYRRTFMVPSKFAYWSMKWLGGMFVSAILCGLIVNDVLGAIKGESLSPVIAVLILALMLVLGGLLAPQHHAKSEVLEAAQSTASKPHSLGPGMTLDGEAVTRVTLDSTLTDHPGVEEFELEQPKLLLDLRTETRRVVLDIKNIQPPADNLGP